MPRIFISYATTDRPFVLRLTRSLERLGHVVWVDAEQITVGQGIPQQVARAVHAADYLIVVLSERSVRSAWSEQEWCAKYWEEVTTQRTAVLPILLDDCEVPYLLCAKRYADFRDEYDTGLAQLERALRPHAALVATDAVWYADRTMSPAQLTEVHVEIHVPYIGMITGVWKPDERERDAAWEMYVELVTRISVADPLPGDGSLRESLSSLYSLFTTTRQILRSYGPAIARPKSGSQLSFGYLSINVLNFVLRPVLTKWHPLLLDYEHRRPAEVSPLSYEEQWHDAEELHEVLRRVRGTLLEYCEVLAQISGVPMMSPR